MQKKTNVTVVEPSQHMSSSLALSMDILATANTVAGLLGLQAPFVVSQMKPSGITENSTYADLIILPGLGFSTEKAIRSSFQSSEFKELIDWLSILNRTDTVIATSCTGVFALGALGLIDHKKVTTTWWLAPLLLEIFPKTQLRAGEIVVEDGNIVTAGAALAHIDLMLHLVERFAGIAIAEGYRRFLVIDDRRSQIPYLSVATLVAAGPNLRKAESFVRQNIQTNIRSSEIALASGLGLRTFARRLAKVAAMTSIQFLQTIRILQAIKLAKTTRLANDEIAFRVGYSDATSLRRVVRQQTGHTLEAFRDK